MVESTTRTFSMKIWLKTGFVKNQQPHHRLEGTLQKQINSIKIFYLVSFCCFCNSVAIFKTIFAGAILLLTLQGGFQHF